MKEVITITSISIASIEVNRLKTEILLFQQNVYLQSVRFNINYTLYYWFMSQLFVIFTVTMFSKSNQHNHTSSRLLSDVFVRLLLVQKIITLRKKNYK